MKLSQKTAEYNITYKHMYGINSSITFLLQQDPILQPVLNAEGHIQHHKPEHYNGEN